MVLSTNIIVYTWKSSPSNPCLYWLVAYIAALDLCLLYLLYLYIVCIVLLIVVVLFVFVVLVLVVLLVLFMLLINTRTRPSCLYWPSIPVYIDCLDCIHRKIADTFQRSVSAIGENDTLGIILIWSHFSCKMTYFYGHIVYFCLNWPIF